MKSFADADIAHMNLLKIIKQSMTDLTYKRLNIPNPRYGVPCPLLKYLKRHNKIQFIDVGAHNGDFTKAIETYCGITKGILIEPLPDKLDDLKQVFQFPAYQVFGCAVSSENGVAEFEINEFEATSSLLNIKRELHELKTINLGTRKVMQCQVRTLDDIVKEANMKSVDLLKLDVQGAEHLVIQGGTNTLQVTSMIWTEISFKPLYEKSSDFFEIYTTLNSIGFKLKEIEPGFRGPDGELLQADSLFVRGNS